MLQDVTALSTVSGVFGACEWHHPKEGLCSITCFICLCLGLVHCISPSAGCQRAYRGHLLGPGVWGPLSTWEGLFKSCVWAYGSGCCQWKCLGEGERAAVSLWGRRCWSPSVQEVSSASIDLGRPSWSVCQTEVLLPLSVPPDPISMRKLPNSYINNFKLLFCTWCSEIDTHIWLYTCL